MCIRDSVYIGHNAGFGTGCLGDGSRNVAIGRYALYSIQGGDCNVAMGYNASICTTSGSMNVTLGTSAGHTITTGQMNIAIGCKAMGTGTVTGQQNIAIGKNAGTDITSGGYNILFGRQAASGLTTGSSNIAMGTGTLGGDTGATTTGHGNVTIGNLTAVAATSACCNVIIGHGAGRCINTAQQNVYLGRYAGYNTTSGSNNVLVGRTSGCKLTTQQGNIGIGQCTLLNLCQTGGINEGCYNVAVGHLAGQAAYRDVHSVMVGYRAGNSQTCTTGYNIFLGAEAGLGKGTSTTGGCNFGAGYRALSCLTSGVQNIAIGYDTLFNVSSGSHNIAFGGCCAGKNITTGSNNIAIGCKTEVPTDSGNCQLAIGVSTCRWFRGDSSFNVCLGNSTAIKAMASGTMCATCFVGCGAGLTGIAAGFSPDADENLVAGTNAAASFDGTNSYINTGLTLGSGTQLSWSAWIKTSNTKNTYLTGDFDSGGANANHRFSVRLYSQNFQASVNNAAGGLGTTITFGTFAHYGEWAHLVVTVDGTAVKGYVNGSQLGSTGTSSQSLASGVNAFVLGNFGASAGNTQQFDGKIDQVRIFNSVLTTTQITELYNETTTEAYRPTTGLNAGEFRFNTTTGYVAVSYTHLTLPTKRIV